MDAGDEVRKVPVTMAPSWSVCLFPVCLGAMSVKQTDWEHICTPHSSTEASPATEEQAGLLAAPASVPSFQLCSKPVLEPERTGRAGECSAHRTWQLQDRGARLSCPEASQVTPSLAQCGSALLTATLEQLGQQEPRQHTDAAQGLVPVARTACKKLPPALQESQEPWISLLTFVCAFQHMALNL